MEKYIYKITNKINGLSYIGQAKDYKKRFSDHRAMMYGKEPEKKLYKNDQNRTFYLIYPADEAEKVFKGHDINPVHKLRLDTIQEFS